MNGYINVDKPQGRTSFSVVGKIRGLLGVKRVGHAGTLDPMATGVLPILVGKGTKTMAYLDDEAKSYRATCQLGRAYDTEDIWGKVREEKPFSIDEEEVRRVLLGFVGDIWQVPPMYSALKKEGKKLVDLAREGIEVERAPRKRTLYAVEDIEVDEEKGIISFSVSCSRGTYIRTLCVDLARSLGTVGALSALERTKSHVCTIEEAWSLEAIEEAFKRGDDSFLLPLDGLFMHHPAIMVPPERVKPLRHGVKMDLSTWADEKSTLYRVYGLGEFLGLARRKGKIVGMDKRMDG